VLKNLTIIVAMFTLSACTTASSRLDKLDLVRPAAGTRVLVVRPSVKLSMLTVAGIKEAKADWSREGADNIAVALSRAISDRDLSPRPFDPNRVVSAKIIQVLKLNQAVGSSILDQEYGLTRLATKQGRFDWSLGEGAQVLGATYDADLALFITCRGTYSSDARRLAMVAMAAMGQALPPGHQTVFASLVDLHTGKVVWFTTALAGFDADIRHPEGADRLAAALIKVAPL